MFCEIELLDDSIVGHVEIDDTRSTVILLLAPLEMKRTKMTMPRPQAT